MPEAPAEAAPRTRPSQDWGWDGELPPSGRLKMEQLPVFILTHLMVWSQPENSGGEGKRQVVGSRVGSGSGGIRAGDACSELFPASGGQGRD